MRDEPNADSSRNETGDDLHAPSVTTTKLTREQQRSVDLAECGAKIDAMMTEYGVRFTVVQHMHVGPNGGPVYSYDVSIASK